MKKYLFILIACVVSFSASAEERLKVYSGGQVVFESPVSSIKDVRFSGLSTVFYLEDSSFSIPFADIDSMKFAIPPKEGDLLSIRYDGETVEVVNPYAEQGVVVRNTGAQVTVAVSNEINNLRIQLSGQTSNGSLKVGSVSGFDLILSSLDLTNVSAQAINLTKDVPVRVILKGKNKIADSATNEKNNAFTSTGDLSFQGEGSLSLVANKKNGISGDKALTIQGGSLTVCSAIEDGKAIKCDGDMTINGGTLHITVSGNQSKGLSAKGNLFFNDGTCTILASGTTALTASTTGYDTSYCSAIKADGNVSIAGGAITITLPSANKGGKGISSDAILSVTGGNIAITTAGDGATYTNTSGVTDSYSSSCLKSNGNMELLAGTITCISTGKGGKGISTDGTLVLGVAAADNADLTLEVRTSGEQFFVASAGRESDYCNPKAIRSEGNMTVNSGTITVICSQTGEGGEGMESKATYTVNGGNIHIETYDDCINASTHIQINGGTIYCKASGNDAIDSNGTVSVTGGLVIANGSKSPECGIDCDQNAFTITGGTIIGTGGDSSVPSTSTAKQPTIKYTGLTAGNAICIKNPDGEVILLFQLPNFSSSSSIGGPKPGGGGGSSSMTLLFSDPKLVVNTSKNYTMQYGGSITGGTTVNGYNTGGTYTGGSSKTFLLNTSYKAVN